MFCLSFSIITLKCALVTIIKHQLGGYRPPWSPDPYVYLYITSLGKPGVLKLLKHRRRYTGVLMESSLLEWNVSLHSYNRTYGNAKNMWLIRKQICIVILPVSESELIDKQFKSKSLLFLTSYLNPYPHRLPTSTPMSWSLRLCMFIQSPTRVNDIKHHDI